MFLSLVKDLRYANINEKLVPYKGLITNRLTFGVLSM